MRRLLKNYARRFYYAIRNIGKPDWMRRMDLLIFREAIERFVEEKQATAQEVIAALISKGMLQFDEAQSLEKALVKSGHMTYASSEELPQIRARQDELLDAAVTLGLLDEDDLEELRAESDDDELDARPRQQLDPLQEKFGRYISGGTAKRDDPIVITDKHNYVAVERAIADFIVRTPDTEFVLEEQRLLQINGRIVDELVFAVKPLGAREWTTTRRLFFDVTEGFNA